MARLAPTPGTRRRRLRVAAGLFMLAVALAAVPVASAWWFARQIEGALDANGKAALRAQALPVLGTAPTGDIVLPQARGGQTKVVLLLGSDRRPGEEVASSDTIILARIDPVARTAALLTLPRDMLVDIPGHGRDRINAAYRHGGPALTIKTIRDALGVRIDHYAEVDFTGFRSLVDSLGGVLIPVDDRYYNRNSKDDGEADYAEIDLEPGYQLLGGSSALAFARYRHTDTDYHRAARQEVFLRALRDRLGTLETTDKVRLAREAATTLNTDIRDLDAAIGLVDSVREIPDRNIVRLVPEGTGFINANGKWVLEVSRESLRTTMRRWSGVGTSSGAAPSTNAPAEALPGDRKATSGSWSVSDWETDGKLDELGARGAFGCTPTQRADGFRLETVRGYRLRGNAAWAASYELAPGSSYLWMATRWAKPPLLAGPSTSSRRNGRIEREFYEGGKLKRIAFRSGGATVWLENTLGAELSRDAMRAIAAGCTARA